MRGDAELLQAYAVERSEAAFAELLRRHVDLVYSAALRQVGGDAHLAQDVTQGVFIDLSRKASSLAGCASLAGWLYTAAHFAAAKVVRGERRRRAREEEAQLMNELTSETAARPDWERLRPVLDAAMLDLGASDREAVVLRFLAGRSFAEVGRALRLPEDTARKRVERALDKLHGLLAARGVTSSAAVLALALTQNAVSAAPAGVVTAVGAAVSADAAAGAGATLPLLLMSKIKFAVIAAVLALTLLLLQQRFALVSLREEVAGLQVQSNRLSATRADANRAAARLGGPAPDRGEPAPVLDIEPWPRAPSVMGRTNLRADLDSTYAPLFRRLRLAPEELERMRDLLVERERSEADVRKFTKGAIDTWYLADQIELQEVGARAIDRQIRELIGDQRFEYFVNFQRTQPWRVVYENFTGVLSPWKFGLPATVFTDEQVDQLAAWSRESGPDLSPEANYGPAGGTRIPEAVVARARAILSPAQWEILKEMKLASDARRQSQAMIVEAIRQRAPARGEPGNSILE